MSETDLLIQAKDRSESKEPSAGITWRHLTALPALLMYFLSVSTFTYVLTEWTQNKCALEYFANATVSNTAESCSEANQSIEVKELHDKVQHDASVWNWYYKVAEYVPLIFTNLLFSSLTDAYGRKYLVVFSVCSILTKLGISTVVIYFNASPWFIVAAYFIEGVTAAHNGFMCAIFTITADITTSKHRVFGIVVIETTAFVAVTFSSGLAGLLIGTLSFGFFKTGLLCFVVDVVAFLVIILFVPESLPKHKRVQFSVWEAIKRPLKFYVSSEYKGMRQSYILLLVSFSLCSVILFARSELETLYLLGKPFCFGPADLGYYIMARHAAASFLGMALLKLLTRCMSSEAITQLSTLSAILSYVIEGFAHSSLVLYVGGAVGMLDLLALPMIRGVLSTITPSDKQGSIFAIVSVVEAIGSLVGSTFSNMLYAQTVSIWPGLVFEGLAVVGVINLVNMFIYIYVKPKKDLTTGFMVND